MQLIGNTCVRWSAATRAWSRCPRAASTESPSDLWLVLLFAIEKQMPMSAVIRFSRTVLLLLVVVACSLRLVRASPVAPNALHSLAEITHPYGSIFSPLLKALSEYGGSRWNQGSTRNVKPEHKYMKYLTEVYKRSSRVRGSSGGNEVYNTIRLIKPQDECLAQSSKGKEVNSVTASWLDRDRTLYSISSRVNGLHDQHDPKSSFISIISMSSEKAQNTVKYKFH